MHIQEYMSRIYSLTKGLPVGSFLVGDAEILCFNPQYSLPFADRDQPEGSPGEIHFSLTPVSFFTHEAGWSD